MAVMLLQLLMLTLQVAENALFVQLTNQYAHHAFVLVMIQNSKLSQHFM